MTDLDEIYSARILELSAMMAPPRELTRPDASATAHSKLCGSTVSVQLQVNADGIITDYTQRVKACLLGQASAAIVEQNIIGTSMEEMTEVGNTVRAMLKENGPAPDGKWQDFQCLECVRDFRPRHASTLLVFDALETAFQQLRAPAAVEILTSVE